MENFIEQMDIHVIDKHITELKEIQDNLYSLIERLHYLQNVYDADKNFEINDYRFYLIDHLEYITSGEILSRNSCSNYSIEDWISELNEIRENFIQQQIEYYGGNQ